ncbi:MAG: hypothetical protein H6836_03710 [Planctomycetes bacterium]|nr:hypothetical protein [Planctomycetota bacterium]
MNRLHLTSFFVLLTGALPAQNLVTNGDFNSGNSNGWTFAGYTLGAAVDMFDTNGIGSSNCFNCRPGGQVTPPPYAPNSMAQNVLVIQGIEHLFTCDLANSRLVNLSNADGGTVEVYVDNVLVARHAFGNYVSGSTNRNRLCARFTPTATGQKELKITFHRNYLTSTGTNPTPTVYIDNISLIASPNLPVLCPRGERKVGTTMNLEVSGTANAQFALFVSPAALSSGFQIPGFGGLWWLGNPLLQVVNGLPLDAGGLNTLNLPVPNVPGLAGLPLYWQAIQASGSTVTVGELALFGVY